jgi:glycosyltransferase involved in cell wall biosynthesis
LLIFTTAYMKVDLVVLTDRPATTLDWQLGRVLTAAPSVAGVIAAKQQVADNNREWVLFWDENIDIPSTTLLDQLTMSPVDVWHSGLKTGVANLPHVMNHVDPTWMYNKNASEDFEHTNFRLSFRSLLIKTCVIKRMQDVVKDFISLEMAGVALGYALLKSGAIIRYTPLLVNKTQTSTAEISMYDEWVFAKKFYTPKWHWWLLLTMPGFLKNIVHYNKTSGIEAFNTTPNIHPSNTTVNAVYKSVSVLAPTLDRYEYLIAELEQLAKQDVLPLEVLITDQTPSGRRQVIDTTQFSHLNIRIFIQEESGQCVAWNKLLEEAKGEYVLFLGDDADNITPDFIARLLATSQSLNADMVAANVIEAGISYKSKTPFYYLSDTFPITLIKRNVLVKTGFMDMFYNKNIRADHDLAMRCHLSGALMVFNPSATIFHHRAPVGGLRAHKARVVTNHMVKHSLSKFTVPTASELYLVKKYYSTAQFKSYVRIKFLNQLFIDGGWVRKFVKTIYFIFKSPSLYKKYKQHLSQATVALNANTTRY